MKFIKHWWLEFTTEDGRRWSGWINTLADSKEDFPETISGTFWTYRDEVGCHGEFKLDNGETGFVVTAKMLPPEYKMKTYTPFEADKAFESLQPIKQWERFDKKIEDCRVPEKDSIMEL